MNNMRIVTDNAIDRTMPTVSSQASSSMGVGNLLSDVKSSVWRSANGVTSVKFDATWSTLEIIGCVAFPHCNFSPTATMRVQGTNEPQAANSLTYSQQFDNAIWYKGTGGSVAADTIVAPDGSTTADAYTHGTSSTNFAFLTQGFSADASRAWTYSLWVKVASGTSSLALSISDLTVGSATSSQQTVTTTWKRLTFTVTANQLTNTGQIGVGISGTPGTVYHVWGAQLELGSTATSYYPTTSAAATRPLGYMDNWQTYAVDTGAVQCCPEPAITLRGWTAAQAASAYAYGGGAFARVWLAQTPLYGLRVTVNDANNLLGYLEASRLVAAPYWATAINPSGVTITYLDTTILTDMDSGDQWADAGKIRKKMQIQLSMMGTADRAPFVNMVRNSRAYPILVSVFPQNGDTTLERDCMIYGRRAQDSDVALQAALNYSSTVELRGI